MKWKKRSYDGLPEDKKKKGSRWEAFVVLYIVGFFILMYIMMFEAYIWSKKGVVDAPMYSMIAMIAYLLVFLPVSLIIYWREEKGEHTEKGRKEKNETGS